RIIPAGAVIFPPSSISQSSTLRRYVSSRRGIDADAEVTGPDGQCHSAHCAIRFRRSLIAARISATTSALRFRADVAVAEVAQLPICCFAGWQPAFGLPTASRRNSRQTVCATPVAQIGNLPCRRLATCLRSVCRLAVGRARQRRIADRNPVRYQYPCET